MQREKEEMEEKKKREAEQALQEALQAHKDLEAQIETEANQNKDNQNEEGAHDSDSDDDERIKNMSNPDLRKFNVHDILGDFDRDKKGNLVMLQNQQGELVDKLGNSVNQKGYLIDSKTGDVVEKE